MTWENSLNNILYGVVALVVAWGLVRVWRNMRDRRGLGRQVAELIAWAPARNWKLVDTKVKAPWREQYEETSGTAYLIPKAVALGAIGNSNGMVAVGQVYDEFDGEGQPSIVGNVTYWRLTLTTPSGWLRLRPTDSRFKGQIKETKMESIEFNREVQVHAYPSKLAHEILAPDFMNWYLRQSRRPWIHLHEGKLLIVNELHGGQLDLNRQADEVQRILLACTKRT